MPKDIRWSFTVDCLAEVIQTPDGAWVNRVQVMGQDGQWIAIDMRNVDVSSEEKAMDENDIFYATGIED